MNLKKLNLLIFNCVNFIILSKIIIWSWWKLGKLGLCEPAIINLMWFTSLFVTYDITGIYAYLLSKTFYETFPHPISETCWWISIHFSILQMNYKLTGVRITALCPSFTETPILDTLPGIIAITKGYSVKKIGCCYLLTRDLIVCLGSHLRITFLYKVWMLNIITRALSPSLACVTRLPHATHQIRGFLIPSQINQ